jgi:hypothetical protein
MSIVRIAPAPAYLPSTTPGRDTGAVRSSSMVPERVSSASSPIVRIGQMVRKRNSMILNIDRMLASRPSTSSREKNKVKSARPSVRMT